MSDSIVTSWTVACQAPLSMEFSRKENWSGLPFPPTGDLPDPGIELTSPVLANGFFIAEPPSEVKVTQSCPTLCSVMSNSFVTPWSLVH